MLARQLLPSLVATSRAGFGVILVDQSEGTETHRLVSGLSGVDYLRTPPGLSHGRNAAVAASTSELLAFTDDDVSFSPAWLPRLVAIFDEHPRAGAVCGRAVDSAGRLMPGTGAGTYDWPVHPFGLGSGFNMAFRAEALRQAGDFDPALGAGARYRAGEDSDMLYRVARGGWSVVCSDDITVAHSDWRRPTEMLRLHHAYGIGAGAQTAGHVRIGDRVAARVAGREAGRHVRSLLLYSRALDGHRALLQVTFVAGLVRGFATRLVLGPSAKRGS